VWGLRVGVRIRSSRGSIWANTVKPHTGRDIS
jgi:hypothetical protein